MYSQTPQVGGAEAPKWSLKPVLRDVVVAFLRLSSEEKDRLDSYDNEDCHSALQELVDYANNPAGKPERTIQDVVGEMFLVYQRKTHLQAAEQQAQMAQLQRENASLQRGAQRAQAEFDQAQEDLDLLRAEVHSAQQRAELKHGEDRPGQLESLAKDIERFDPNSPDANIEDYFREVERCLVDLPDATSREKLKLVWKTTARSVHVFMETLPPNIRDRYATLRKALREEYSLYTDEASATLGAFAILQKKHEPPREYFRRLRTAYFQGRNAPGLEEDHAFKSLFLHNLHEILRYDITMHCRTRGLTMQEIKKYAQLAWETRMRPTRGREVDARVLGIQASEDADLALEGSEVPRASTDVKSKPPKQRPPTQQGGRRNQGVAAIPNPRAKRERHGQTPLSREGEAGSNRTPSRETKEIEACNVSITSYTQDSSPITRRAWVDLTFQEMTLVHPLHICTIDTEPLLIGQDLLDRLAPLIDCHRGHIWAQVDTPKPLSQSALGGHVATIQGTFGPRPKLVAFSEPDPGSDLLLPPPATIQPASARNRDSLHSHESFLCALKNTNPALYSPLIIGGVHLNGVSAPDAFLALWSEKSAISQDFYIDLCLLNPSPTFAPRSHRLLSAQTPQTPIKAIGVCALSVRIGRKEVVHLLLISP
ncbi:hypothetical protein ABVT39_002033 [Epinephelus coioides]